MTDIDTLIAQSYLPPKERTIRTPEGGWKERTYYVARVADNPNNPIHRAIIYSGFLSDAGRISEKPGRFAVALNACYVNESVPFDNLHFVEVVRELPEMQEAG